jgi:hypothetical protein
LSNLYSNIYRMYGYGQFYIHEIKV